MKNFLPKSKSNPSGFTLIELMVVISIIAFLAVIGIAAYSNAQKTARDGRRKADIDAISQAMESNYDAVNGKYSSSFTAPSAITSTFFASGVAPVDPTNASPYVYSGNHVNSQKGFWVCATLEGTASSTGPGNASAAGSGTGTSTYPTYSTGNLSLYCKSSQQSQ